MTEIGQKRADSVNKSPSEVVRTTRGLKGQLDGIPLALMEEAVLINGPRRQPMAAWLSERTGRTIKETAVRRWLKSNTALIDEWLHRTKKP